MLSGIKGVLFKSLTWLDTSTEDWLVAVPSANRFQPQVMSHNADFEYAPLFAILADFHVSLIPTNVTAALNNFIGEHTFTASTYSPPFDYSPRNITAWLAPNITIGAESFDENVIGGPAENQDAFNPAVVQWDTGNGIGFISVCHAMNFGSQKLTITAVCNRACVDGYSLARPS